MDLDVLIISGCGVLWWEPLRRGRIVEDLDDPGHLFVISRWQSRDAANAAMSYASHPNARRADEMVSEPRRRTVGVAR